MNPGHDRRRPDIDWLRVLATLLVIAFHVGMVFNPAPFFHIRNGEFSFVLMVACGFISLWHMPLFFVLAGWSLARSIGLRGSAEVVRERMMRLGIPLLTGCVTLMPAIKYIELRSGLDLNHRSLRATEALQEGFRTVIPGGLPVMPEFTDAFPTFLPTFFTSLDRFTWGHLWFVAYLLVFTLALLPLLRRWARRPLANATWPSWIAFAPLPVLVLIQLTLRERWPGIYNLYDDWANVAWYLTFLLSGFALGHDPRLEAAVHAQWKRALALGLATCLVLLAAILGLVTSPKVLLAGTAIAGWSLVVAILGAGRRWLDVSTPRLSWLAEAALPLYVLHQAAIVVPGWWIVSLPLGVAPKFLLLLATAYALTFGVYVLLVKPLQPLRILLGMRPLACPLRPVRRAAAAGPVAVVFLLLLATATGSRAASGPIGLWYAEGGAAQVEIAPCGGSLCGRVVWLRSPLDENGCPLTDRYNPVASERGRSLVGVEILRGLVPVGDSSWDGGTIYDPTSGRTYRCAATLDGENRLRMRGYLGIHLLGRTTTWVRVGVVDERCALPHG